jgi:hypothetical protein
VLQGGFSTLEIHFLFFKNEFREGTYPAPQSTGTKKSTLLWGVNTRPLLASRSPGLVSVVMLQKLLINKLKMVTVTATLR